ncbi:MAG: DUF2325 domain-containing protein [Bilifractor sp.]|jgi:hypothetical protein
MSVVIVGGNECMERQYLELCGQHGCTAKVFCKYKGGMARRIGDPDLLILFTHTVSHKMIQCATDAAGKETKIVRSHRSSMASLKQILQENT